MPIEWSQYLRLPEPVLQDRRILKTVLTAKANPTKREQKTLDLLRELRIYATIGKTNTGILPHIDDTYDIQAVIYLDCTLNAWERTADLSMILHRVFPNPTVLLMRTVNPLDGRMMSVALKRKSLAENNAVVVETVDATGIIDPMDTSAAMFWNTVGYDNLPQNDLLDFVRGMQDAILFHNVRPRLGFMPQPNIMHRVEIREDLIRLKRLDAEINRLRAKRRDKNTTFGESAEIRVLESGKKEEAQTIVDHIKELCHD